MRAAILSIGDELILGQTLDRHAAWLSDRLRGLGVDPVEHRTLPDDRAQIAAAIAALAATHDVLLVTGGLGPTDDDLTREALGDVFAPGLPLETDHAAERRLRAWFRGRALPEKNLRQAQHPRGMTTVENPHGTAPGLAGCHGACRVWAMPGPGREMYPMFDTAVAPVLDAGPPDHICAVHAFGIGESLAAERIAKLTGRDRQPLVGTTASDGIVTARIRGRDGAAVEADARAVEDAWAPYVWGRDAQTHAGAIIAALAEDAQTLAVAESCTGGWLGKQIVDEAGASAVFLGGWITYTNALKVSELGVPAEAIEREGAVSAPVAAAMAEGVRRRAGATHGVGITGIAGPDGAVPGKPVGTVFIGVAGAAGAAVVRRFRFPGDRSTVRARSVGAALQMLFLERRTGDPMLWPMLWEAPSDPVEAES